MVIQEFNIGRAFVRPPETQPKLVVDPDRILTRPVALQRLQPVGGWNSKVFKAMRSIQHHKLAPNDGSKVRRKPLRHLPAQNGNQTRISEVSDCHRWLPFCLSRRVSYCDTNFNRLYHAVIRCKSKLLDFRFGPCVKVHHLRAIAKRVEIISPPRGHVHTLVPVFAARIGPAHGIGFLTAGKTKAE